MTALHDLQKAYEERDWALITLAVEPRLGSAARRSRLSGTPGKTQIASGRTDRPSWPPDLGD
jgi:hypothetical protein